MFTARSILSFAATSTATQCSAALPTIATTNTPTKNSDRPISSRRLRDRADEDLATSGRRAPPRSASRPSDLRDRPAAPRCSCVLARVRVEERRGASSARRTGRRRSVSIRMIATPSERCSTVACRSPRAPRRRRAGRRRGSAGTAPAGSARRAPAAASPTARARRCALKVCLSRFQPPTSIDAPSTSRMLPMIEPTIEAFTTSWRPSLQREEGDDQLGRVAERHVQQAADARARSGPPAPRSPRPSAPPSGSRRARRRRRPAPATACASSSATATGMKMPRK